MRRTRLEWRNAVEYRVMELYEHLGACPLCASVSEDDFCTERQARRTKLEDAIDKMEVAPGEVED